MDNTEARKDIADWVIENLMAQQTLPSLREINDEINQAEAFVRTCRAQGWPDERIRQAYRCPEVRVALKNGILLQPKDMDKLLQINRSPGLTRRI